MSVPPGMYRLRAVPNWERPPPQVGGMYATYNRAPKITLSPEGGSLRDRQLWEVLPVGEGDAYIIKTPLIGTENQFMHNRGTQNGDPVELGDRKAFRLERNHELPGHPICQILLLDVPREIGAVHCVGTRGGDVVTKVIPMDGESDIPGWELIPEERE
ncbi:unnamed protein product [Rhizoctonia solani]|uniref:Uncharacterized protein n=1 Tax=Rhizoctonia solani TaxID=456999 RepID=A0A8H3GHQ0_9AGAM|nr:unnamed protein product [Rhizoctonia solani]